MSQHDPLQPQVLRFTIFGEACSKANSRQQVDMPRKGGGTRRTSIKSEKALAFEADALRQIPTTARKRLTGPVHIVLRIFYASERPDLDESLVLDVLQDRYTLVPAAVAPGEKPKKKRLLIQNGVYCNDRQIKRREVLWALDKKNPRVEVALREMHDAELQVLQRTDLMELFA
jgi:hypothetical protein